MIDQDYKKSFLNKNVLIVGGSRGFGLMLVKKFLQLNSNVYYISRKKNSLSDAVHIKADLSNIKSINKSLAKIEKFGIDILINCAAINFAKKFNQIKINEWNKVMQVNLTSIFFITQSVLKNMKKNKFGKIVNVSSIAGRHRSIVSGAHYVASKSALIGLTRQLAYEVGEYNININVVCPSQTKTEMYNKTMTPKKENELLKNIPLNRIAIIKEQIEPIIFLCSNNASYLTGSVIDINGGQI